MISESLSSEASQSKIYLTLKDTLNTGWYLEPHFSSNQKIISSDARRDVRMKFSDLHESSKDPEESSTYKPTIDSYSYVPIQTYNRYPQLIRIKIILQTCRPNPTIRFVPNTKKINK